MQGAQMYLHTGKVNIYLHCAPSPLAQGNSPGA